MRKKGSNNFVVSFSCYPQKRRREEKGSMCNNAIMEEEHQTERVIMENCIIRELGLEGGGRVLGRIKFKVYLVLCISDAAF